MCAYTALSGPHVDRFQRKIYIVFISILRKLAKWFKIDLPIYRKKFPSSI